MRKLLILAAVLMAGAPALAQTQIDYDQLTRRQLTVQAGNPSRHWTGSVEDSEAQGIINVMAKGAKGDGSTDDAPAIASAVAALRSTGGTIVFPCGEYFVNTAQNAPANNRSFLYFKGKSNITFEGQGSCSHIFTTMPLVTLIEFQDSSEIKIHGLRLTTPNGYMPALGAGSTAANGAAIRFTGVRYGEVSGNEIDGASYSAIYLTGSTRMGTKYVSVHDNKIHDLSGMGIAEDDCNLAGGTSGCAPSMPPYGNSFTSNALVNVAQYFSSAHCAASPGTCPLGAMVTDSSVAYTHTIIANNTIEFTSWPNHWAKCIHIGNTSGTQATGNTCYSPAWDGIDVSESGAGPGYDITIANNKITGANHNSATNGSAITVYVGVGGGLGGAIIANNTIYNSRQTGIQVHSDAGASALYDVAVVGNVVLAADTRSPGSTDGIEIGPSTNAHVIGNTVDGRNLWHRYGLHLDSRAVNVIHAANQLIGAKAGAAANFRSDPGAVVSWYNEDFTTLGNIAAGGSGTFKAGVEAPTYKTTLATPANSSAACNAGQMWADANYVYVCTATNTIKRAALSTF